MYSNHAIVYKLNDKARYFAVLNDLCVAIIKIHLPYNTLQYHVHVLLLKTLPLVHPAHYTMGCSRLPCALEISSVIYHLFRFFCPAYYCVLFHKAEQCSGRSFRHNLQTQISSFSCQVFIFHTLLDLLCIELSI